MLTLDHIRRVIDFKISDTVSMHYLCRIIDGKYNIVLDFDVYLPTKGKNLQRPLVWTLFQKQQH